MRSASARLYICASEYSSEYLSGANIQSFMPDIVDILWFEMKDSSSLAGTKAIFSLVAVSLIGNVTIVLSLFIA